jgi:hypothetical protein
VAKLFLLDPKLFLIGFELFPVSLMLTLVRSRSLSVSNLQFILEVSSPYTYDEPSITGAPNSGLSHCYPSVPIIKIRNQVNDACWVAADQ